MEIRPYTKELEVAVAAFNSRLRDGGDREYRFPERHIPDAPKGTGRDNHYLEAFLAVDGDTVRGGYLLLHQKFAIRDEIRYLRNFQMPISEAIINRNYSMVAIRMLRHALSQYSLLFSLGLGGLQGRLAKLLTAVGWKLELVPFYFKVLNASEFLRNLAYLRADARKRLVLDVARYSGIGWAGSHVAQFRIRRPCLAIAQEVGEFGTWADSVWEQCNKCYSFLAVRDSGTLNALYSEPKFLRFKISRAGQTIGWVVLLDTKMSGHKHFGNMRLGSIVDCLARPDDAGCVIRCASGLFESRGVDLIVSNQANSAWCDALSKHGFLKGPTNFVLAVSQDLFQKLQPFEAVKSSIHMNRGDGDGPIHM
jgi:hypothetical protein